MGLGQWLSNLSLVGRESRERSKFVETLAAELKEAEETRLEIVKKFAEVDDKGEPVIKEDDDGKTHYSVPDEKMSEFTAELQAYLNENFVVDGEGNRQRLRVVKSIVLDTQEKIEPAQAPEYAIWCEAFEKVEV